MPYALLIRWTGDAGTGEWPATTGPFETEDDARAEFEALRHAGEIEADTHEFSIVPLYPPTNATQEGETR